MGTNGFTRGTMTAVGAAITSVGIVSRLERP